MISFILKIVKPKSNLHKRLKRTYNHFFGYPQSWKVDILKEYAKHFKNVKFIQIGSNDGVGDDPLHDYITRDLWGGVLIEPVPYLFEALKRNYPAQQKGLFFENTAISSFTGHQKFYRLKQNELTDVPHWYDKLGSFRREVLLKHRNKIPHFDELLVEEEVPTITFKELLDKYSMTSVNIVQIDTEGYDYEILKMVPFENTKIDLIMFEHRHLSRRDYKSAIKLLSKNGYALGTNERIDTVAVKIGVLKELSL